jgi:hypothetical protein
LVFCINLAVVAAVKENTVSRAVTTDKKAKRKMVAPDGKVPNSMIFKEVEDWKEEHGITDTGAKKFRRRRKTMGPKRG